MIRILPLVLMIPLAACTSPRDTCLKQATGQLATVERLIKETEGNLQRGYGYQRETYTTTSVGYCFGQRGYRSNVGVGWSYCNQPRTRVRNVPVTIDPAVERRKLADLKRKRQQLAPKTRTAIEQCNRLYPPTG